MERTQAIFLALVVQLLLLITWARFYYTSVPDGSTVEEGGIEGKGEAEANWIGAQDGSGEPLFFAPNTTYPVQSRKFRVQGCNLYANGRLSFPLPKTTWKWFWFDSPYYNLGLPLIVFVCDQMEDLPEGKHECERLAEFRRAANLSQELPAYPRTAHHKLLRDTGTVFVWLPVKAGHASTGPYVLHALHNALGKAGIPSQMFTMTDIPGYMNQYSHSLEAVPDWASLPPDFVVISPESNSWLKDQRSAVLARKGRIAKWHMGFHHAPEAQMDESAVNICHTHWTLTNFLCPGAGVLWGPNPPSIYEQALEMDNRKLKTDLVLYDNDFAFDEALMRKLVPGVEFKRFAGFSREQTIDLYRRAKATIDFGLPGSESINAEGSCFDAATIISATGCGSSDQDFNFDARYKVDPTNYTELAEVVRDVVHNYHQRIDDFAFFKKVSFQVPHRFERDVQLYFHSRGALFYIHAGNLYKMQAVVPLILSIRHLYPLAHIEILGLFDLAEWTQINKVMMRDLRMHLPFVTFVKMTAEQQNKGIASLYIVRPKNSNSHFTVFLDAETLLLGRDLLSLRVEALDREGLVALVFSQPEDQGSGVDTRIVVARSKTYWQLVRDKGGHDQLKHLSPEEIFGALGIQALRQEPDAGSEQLPLPLDVLFLNCHAGTMSLAITQSWSVDWEEVVTSTQYGQVKELIGVLVTHPLWQLVSAHFPSVYQQLTTVGSFSSW